MSELASIVSKLVDPYCGIITEVSRNQTPPGFPQVFFIAGRLAAPYFYRTHQAPLRYTERANHAAGCGLTYEDAMWRMIGESVERYCALNADESKIFQASYNELGDAAVSPLRWIGYTDGVTQHPRYQFDPGAPMHWGEAKDLRSGKTKFVPASLVWLSVPLACKGDKFHQTTSSGLAAGRTRNDAVASALSELIERDCFMSRWMLRCPPPRIERDADSVQGLDPSLLKVFRDGPLKAELFDLSIDAPEHTILARVSLANEERFGIALGASSNIDRGKALTKALIEALQICILLVSRRGRTSNSLKLEEVESFLDHGDFYAQPEAADGVDFFFGGGSSVARKEEKETFPQPYDRHLNYLSSQNIDAYLVDLTTDDVSEIGFHVVRCLTPGLQPLTHGYGNHTLDHRRLFQVAPHLGLPADSAINTMLHPFA
ncbi:YcaO-like family protein [Agrobacterium sp. CCNWLW71]|uniref:YcaO-like family protein n=1 Tax=unclassified Agrobacterium TaxID=2632611 RepID=UPI002FEF89F4